MRCASVLSVLLALFSACGEPERAVRKLAPEATIEARIKRGETHAYGLSLNTGQYAGIVVDQQGADVAVTLHDPDGNLLSSVDSLQGARVPEQVPVIATAAGTYRVEVSISEKEGSYAIRIDALRPATAEDRTRVRAERLLSEAEKLQARDDRSSREAAAARAREAAGLLADPSRKGDAFYALGNALYYLDDNAGSRDAYGRALALFRETGRERETGKALNGLGRTLRQEEPERALALYREALALYRGLGDLQQEATTLHNLGTIHQSLGETEEALAHYERALPIWSELGVKTEEASTLRLLGDLYQRMGEPRKALDLLPRAIAQFEAAGSSGDAASTLTTLGDAQARAGQAGEALASYTRALAIHRRNGNRREEAQALNSIGCCHFLLGRPEEARQPLAAARSVFQRIGDRSSEAVALVNLGLSDEQRPRRAIASFEAAMPSLSSHDYEALALLGLARAHRRLGDLASARKEAEAAIGHIEALRGKSAGLGMRASFLASKQDYYGFYVDLLMDLHRREPGAGYDARALAASEQARARSLLDMLADSSKMGGDPGLADRINDLARRPAGPELRELLAQQERAQARSRPLTSARPLSLPEIQSEVADGETLILQYALGRERSFLWAVTPDSLASFELPPRERIEETARRVHGLLSAPPQTLARARTRREMAELSRMLLAPAAGLLEGKRLVVVPDGALHYVPFAALPSPGSEEPLVVRHEIVTLPSSSTLAAIRREARPPAAATLAVVADPVFARGEKLGRLPFSREEAEALLALAPPAWRMGALGSDASRETVLSGRLAGYRLVHFATHGILDADNPELSGLLLSDGFLRAHEIYRLSLPADLVVLSACRTALGREMRGEGLVGLTRGFLHAGARSVLVSLWEVEDRATAELMRRFYREMLKEGRPPAAALRAAQASLRREPGREAPYFWAGFVLQGDWQPR